MSKARRPVNINGITFDALIESNHELASTVPQYSVESGFSVSDAIILEPEKLAMVLYLTDTPITWRGQSGQGSVERRVRQLEELYYTATPVTIVTSERSYTNMAITLLNLQKDSQNGYGREIPIEFQKIRVTTSSTTTIPDSYGKSGETEANAGTANTAQGNTGAGSSGTGGSGSGNGQSDKASIMYGLAEQVFGSFK